MALTFEEIKARLKRFDEETLCELLGISSEEIVERFEDIVENDIERYEEEVSQEEDRLAS